MKYYFSFGFGHEHIIGGLILDRNCLVEVETDGITESPDDMLKAREVFTEYLKGSGDWSFQRSEAELAGMGKEKQKFYFPRGVVKKLSNE